MSVLICCVLNFLRVAYLCCMHVLWCILPFSPSDKVAAKLVLSVLKGFLVKAHTMISAAMAS